MTDKEYERLLVLARQGERVERRITTYLGTDTTYLCPCGRWVADYAESVHAMHCKWVTK
jgi:hypothetical protein